MKLTILGSGTCVNQLPGIPNRFPPAFLVEWGAHKMLFDCSESVRFRLEFAGFDYADIHHIAISHAHPDHYALTHYIQAVFVKPLWGGEHFKNERIDVYCPDQIAEDFPKEWDIFTPELRGREKFPWPKTILHGMTQENARSIAVEDATLTTVPAYHGFGRVDALSFRLETPEGVFVYSGDTGWNDALPTFAKDADLFVCEASARVNDEKNAFDYGHLNAKQSGEIAKRANAKHLILFHYTGLDSDDALRDAVQASSFNGKMTIGKDFEVIRA